MICPKCNSTMDDYDIGICAACLKEDIWHEIQAVYFLCDIHADGPPHVACVDPDCEIEEARKELATIGYQRLPGDPDAEEEELQLDTFMTPTGRLIDYYAAQLSAESVILPKPDPVPGYHRGRSYIEPRPSRAEEGE